MIRSTAWIREEKMNDRNKVASFITYHNIIRPIFYPLICAPFFSGILLLVYIISAFLSPNKYPLERVFCYLGMLQAIIIFIVGMKIKRKYLKLYETKPGESFYMAEVWKYVFFTIMAIYMSFYCILLHSND